MVAGYYELDREEYYFLLEQIKDIKDDPKKNHEIISFNPSIFEPISLSRVYVHRIYNHNSVCCIILNEQFNSIIKYGFIYENNIYGSDGKPLSVDELLTKRFFRNIKSVV